MQEPWYKNAVIYAVDVETFQDSDGDGIGDFRGLAARLDHIARLGATCIWLLPFYPTPDRDNGFDITDYYGVDPRLGTLDDFVAFVDAARARGLRVIADLVINHTSDQHPWFQAARQDPASPYRDWYLWRDERPADAADGVVFPGVQEAVWTRDPVAGAWYFHRFYAHQPDLNIDNPQVRAEICRIMEFWLARGLAGFRLDAAPFVIERIGRRARGEDPHAYLVELRDFIDARDPEAVFLAEANIKPETVDEYVGRGDRMHMLFNFWANQHLFLALACGCAAPLRQALGALPALPARAQWAMFLRNHDELDLGRLSAAAREQVFAAFAPDPAMRIYGRGIRRRLGPMLGGEPARLELAWSLLLTITGTPVLWYGEEIGMGEDLDLAERNAVRTPMQWSAAANGGFSEAAPARLVRPAVAAGRFGFPSVNAAQQWADAGSLLRRIARMIEVRRAHPAFGAGELGLLEADHPAVLAHVSRGRDATVLAVHNLSAGAAEVAVSLPDTDAARAARAVDLFGDGEAPAIAAGRLTLALPASGFRWFRLAQAGGG